MSRWQRIKAVLRVSSGARLLLAYRTLGPQWPTPDTDRQWPCSWEQSPTISQLKVELPCSASERSCFHTCNAMIGKSVPKRHLSTDLLTGLLTALCTKSRPQNTHRLTHIALAQKFDLRWGHVAMSATYPQAFCAQNSICGGKTVRKPLIGRNLSCGFPKMPGHLVIVGQDTPD
jgi:hypothetical protein